MAKKTTKTTTKSAYLTERSALIERCNALPGHAAYELDSVVTNREMRGELLAAGLDA